MQTADRTTACLLRQQVASKLCVDDAGVQRVGCVGRGCESEQTLARR